MKRCHSGLARQWSIFGLMMLLSCSVLLAAPQSLASNQRVVQLELLGLSQPLAGMPLSLSWQRLQAGDIYPTQLHQQQFRSNEHGQFVLPTVAATANRIHVSTSANPFETRHRWLVLNPYLDLTVDSDMNTALKTAAPLQVQLFPSYFLQAVAEDLARLTAADFHYSRFNDDQRQRLIMSLAAQYGFDDTQLAQAYGVMEQHGRLMDQALIYYLQGRWSLAAEYFEVVRSDTPHLSAQAQYFVALSHYQQGHYALSAELLQPLVVLHPERQQIRDWLGHSYRHLGQWALAEDHYAAALTTARAQATDSDGLASRLKNLADLYTETQRYQQAEGFLNEALNIQSQQYPAQHITILELRHRLAKLYQYDARYAQAQETLEYLLEQKRLMLGTRHPALGDLHHELALVLEAQEAYPQAVQHLRQALLIDRNYHGQSHPQLAVRMNNLALMLKHQQAYDEAEQLLAKASKIVGNELGEGHPSYAVALNNHASLIKQRGEYARAEAMMWRVVAIDEAALGVEHPGLAVDLGNLAQLLLLQERVQEAEILMHRSLRILLLDSQRRSVLHPQLPDVMNGYVYLLQQRGFSDMEIERRILQVKNEVAASDS